MILNFLKKIKNGVRLTPMARFISKIEIDNFQDLQKLTEYADENKIESEEDILQMQKLIHRDLELERMQDPDIRVVSNVEGKGVSDIAGEIMKEELDGADIDQQELEEMDEAINLILSKIAEAEKNSPDGEIPPHVQREIQEIMGKYDNPDQVENTESDKNEAIYARSPEDDDGEEIMW